MKKYKIFVSSEKRLEEQRRLLKVLANDMNVDYGRRGINRQIDMRSYVNFADSQDEYDSYIKDTADIVIFILDGRIGEGTEHELKIATEAFRKKNRPDPIVMVKKFDSSSADENVCHMEDTINRYLNGINDNEQEDVEARNKGVIKDKYYVEYSNNEDLRNKVKERIENMILAQENKNPRKRKLFWGIGAAMFAVAGILFTLFYKGEPELFLVGGGSAANFIDYKLDKHVNTNRDFYYVHMPTGYAWTMLADEILNETKDPRYVPLCISADQAKDKNFQQKTLGNKINKKIVGVQIGWDTLKVFVGKGYKDTVRKNYSKDGKMTIDQLCMFINVNLDNLDIFTTNINSGTWNAYNDKLLEPSVGVEKVKLDSMKLGTDYYYNLLFFSENSEITHFENSNNGKQYNYIIMGSSYYYVKAFKTTNDVEGFTLVDNEGKPIMKKMYLYFIANYTEPYLTIENSKVLRFVNDVVGECYEKGAIENDVVSEYMKGNRIKVHHTISDSTIIVDLSNPGDLLFKARDWKD